jgi:protoporphyrinogen oxidase
VKGGKDIAQKGTDTSLIERFLYPKFGPGQLWEHVAEKVVAMGGEIHMGWKVVGIEVEGTRVVAVEAVNAAGERGGLRETIFCRRCRCGIWCGR